MAAANEGQAYVAVLGRGDETPPQYLGQFPTRADAESAVCRMLVLQGDLFSSLTWYGFNDHDAAERARASALLEEHFPDFREGYEVCATDDERMMFVANCAAQLPHKGVGADQLAEFAEPHLHTVAPA